MPHGIALQRGHARARLQYQLVVQLQGVRRLAVLGVFGVVISCANPPATTPETPTLPVDPRFASMDVTGKGCIGSLVQEPLRARVQIDLDSRETVWLITEDGRRLSVLWPTGFRLGLGPPPSVLDPAGLVLAKTGDLVEFQTIPMRIAVGTPDEPFSLYGPIGADCYTSR